MAEFKKADKITNKTMDTTKVAEFIDCIMVGAVITHKMHLKVTGVGSYAKHKALNELYDALPEHADDLTEKFQGYHGVLIPTYPSQDQTPYLKMEPLAYVEWLLQYVENNRSCFGSITMLQNLVDELVASVAECRYKLKFLS